MRFLAGLGLLALSTSCWAYAGGAGAAFILGMSFFLALWVAAGVLFTTPGSTRRKIGLATLAIPATAIAYWIACSVVASFIPKENNWIWPYAAIAIVFGIIPLVLLAGQVESAPIPDKEENHNGPA